MQPHPDTPNDAAAHGAGDASQFGDLYERHAPRVFRHILSRVRNRTLAEDLTAQTFLQAWQVQEAARPPDGRRFVAWLLTIANNLVIDNHRRMRREIQEPAAIEQLVDASSPEQVALQGALQEELLGAIERLTPEQRFILARRVLDDMAYAEIARIMGKSQGAVRIALFRALAVLRRELADRNFAI
jgi:RNA polymerase sigma-70 factor (ECF subfamily)